MKILIIGAGLSGLMLATKLSNAHEVRVFDKARGVGGRLATRRTDTAKFDHGAQFYRLRDPLAEMHQRWNAHGLVKKWFTKDGVDHFCAPAGMTALAKDLASDLDITLNERAVRIAEDGSVVFESGHQENADVIVFTSPAPQSFEILTASSIQVSIAAVEYSKALVALFENSSPFPLAGEHGYLEPLEGDIFSIADQNRKGVSPRPALTVTMKPSFSEANYDRTDDQILDRLVREVRAWSPEFAFEAAQIKKWRYCQVQSRQTQEYVQVTSSLYLAGDSFGGASLNSAARSANALAQIFARN